MLLVLAGSILTFTMVQEATEVEPFDRGTIVLEQKVDASPVELRWDTRVEPLVEQKFRNIVRQAYDYSCGSAALTTVLNFYVGRSLTERQVMEGLLHYGESERIVERRAFSMLDMKRLRESAAFKDRKSTRLNSSHVKISYAVFCLKKKI